MWMMSGGISEALRQLTAHNIEGYSLHWYLLEAGWRQQDMCQPSVGMVVFGILAGIAHFACLLLDVSASLGCMAWMRVP
jgi:hypothetical protein